MKRNKFISDFFKFSRKIFWGIGVSFSVMVVIVGVAIFIIWVSGFIRNWLEVRLRESMFSRIQQVQETQSGSTVPFFSGAVPGETLVLSSFSDLFSGIGWLDQGKTTMHLDRLVTALTFPPKYKWQKSNLSTSQVDRFIPLEAECSVACPVRNPVSNGACRGDECLVDCAVNTGLIPFRDKSLTGFNTPCELLTGFIELDSRGADTRCLPVRAGSKGGCLSQKGTELVFNGKNLPPPQSLVGKDIVNLSIGALDTKWVVGVVTREADGYSGFVFYFDPVRSKVSNGVDGEKYEKVPGIVDNLILTSKRVGTFGFGGSDSDWLAIYGSYDGIAYRVRDNPREFAHSVTDISRFFGHRVMDGGFHPAIIRVSPQVSAGSASANPVWYVFSLTDKKPKFIKLFQNETDNIEGAIDLTQNILKQFPAGVLGASFLKLTDGVVSPALAPLETPFLTGLAAKVKTADGVEFWEFVDLGFEKEKMLEIASSNLNNYPAEVRSVKLTELDLSPTGADIVFYVSNDGEMWQKVKLNGEVIFPKSDGRRLLWKATVTPNGPQNTSPFFDRIRLDYKVRFL